MAKLKSVRKKYRQKKQKAQRAQKELVKSLHKMLDKVIKPKDNDS